MKGLKLQTIKQCSVAKDSYDYPLILATCQIYDNGTLWLVKWQRRVRGLFTSMTSIWTNDSHASRVDIVNFWIYTHCWSSVCCKVHRNFRYTLVHMTYICILQSISRMTLPKVLCPGPCHTISHGQQYRWIVYLFLCLKK